MGAGKETIYGYVMQMKMKGVHGWYKLNKIIMEIAYKKWEKSE